MSQPELLKQVVDVLTSAGVDYMLTGSWASSLFGEPRTTHDIDLVVDLRSGDVAALAKVFAEPEFYFDGESARRALQERSNFNIIQPSTGDKVDFWMLGDHPFDQSRFGRRINRNLLGRDVWITTPEDTILQKRRWANQLGGSLKQYTDALRVYEVQRAVPGNAEQPDGNRNEGGLDERYLDTWTRALAVESELRRIRAEAD
jgi:hypothetical protein